MPGKTSKQVNARLQIAIDFLNADLERGRPGDLPNAKYDLQRFLWLPEDGSGGVAVVRSADRIEPFDLSDISDDDVKKAQTAGRQLFLYFVQYRDIMRRREKGRPAPSDAVVVAEDERAEHARHEAHFTKTKVSWLLLPTSGAARQPYVVLAANSVPEGFLALLAMLTINTDTGDIRACPVCENLFIRSRRQEYDTSRCQSIATSRAARVRAREKEEAERKKSEARQRRKK